MVWSAGNARLLALRQRPIQQRQQLRLAVYLVFLGLEVLASFFSSFKGLKPKDTELMQKRSPVGWSGASLKTCPRCPPQLVQVTSTRFMPSELSSVNLTDLELATL